MIKERESLAEQLKVLFQQRLDEGETFYGIAAKTGLPQAVVAKYARGFIVAFKPEHLDAVCNYLGVDIVVTPRRSDG